MTAEEVADQLQVTPTTVRRWGREGTMRALRLPGGAWRFPADEIDRFIAKCMVDARQSRPAKEIVDD